jgi:hypothetical protein
MSTATPQLKQFPPEKPVNAFEALVKVPVSVALGASPV